MNYDEAAQYMSKEDIKYYADYWAKSSATWNNMAYCYMFYIINPEEAIRCQKESAESYETSLKWRAIYN